VGKPRRRCGPLTDQQLSIVTLIAEGFSNGQVANRLHLSEHTVAAYVSNAMQRTDSVSRAALVARCYVAGLLKQGVWPPEPSDRHDCDCHASASTPSILTPVGPGAPAPTPRP
jgi:DNA-binding CsgD family transcriptional regulator